MYNIFYHHLQGLDLPVCSSTKVQGRIDLFFESSTFPYLSFYLSVQIISTFHYICFCSFNQHSIEHEFLSDFLVLNTVCSPTSCNNPQELHFSCFTFICLLLVWGQHCHSYSCGYNLYFMKCYKSLHCCSTIQHSCTWPHI